MNKERFSTNKGTCTCTACHCTFGIKYLAPSIVDMENTVQLWTCPNDGCGGKCFSDDLLTEFANSLMDQFDIDIRGISNAAHFPGIRMWLKVCDMEQCKEAADAIIKEHNFPLRIMIKNNSVDISYVKRLGDHGNVGEAVYRFMIFTQALFNNLNAFDQLEPFIIKEDE